MGIHYLNLQDRQRYYVFLQALTIFDEIIFEEILALSSKLQGNIEVPVLYPRYLKTKVRDDDIG